MDLMTTAPGAGLGAMIRTWRERLPPSAAALPVGRARRAAGLRREELADLAGVSVDYVVRLEQGRATTPSASGGGVPGARPAADHRRAGPPVPAGPARTAGGRRDLRPHPARRPPRAHPARGRRGRRVRGGLAAGLVEPQLGRAAGRSLVVAPQLRNFARDRFPVDGGPAHLARWPVTELDSDATDAAVVSDLRRATGRFPHDTRLAELIRDLSAGNERFAELWATGTVAAHREDHKTIEHPSVGPVTVDCDVLTDGDSELKIVIMTAVPGSADETKLRLAVIGGPPVPSSATYPGPTRTGGV